MSTPTVTVVIPTFREEHHIARCLDAVARQTYPNVAEVLVVDGRSDDRTRELALAAGATVLDNPLRIQAAGLNVGLDAAKGDVIVRVDGHCVIADDYVERCVEALERTGAAVVGGAMTPVASTETEQAIAAALCSPLGAGPARFHVGGRPGWVDTVYLGAYRTDLARVVGGYAQDLPTNEDAEFAHRMSAHGGVWFDPSIRSTYATRGSVRSVARQFWRYGQGRAVTAVRHPASISWRQLAAPALVLGILSRWRTPVVLAYAGVLAVESRRQSRRRGCPAAVFASVTSAMHLSWGVGFLIELTGWRRLALAPGRGRRHTRPDRRSG
jgi:glycosyltransferase involved in cell wall biosynthesis